MILLEALRLLGRNPVKYARGVSGMYLLSIKGLELSQIARACFFFFRNQDDALDGDRQDIKDPLAHVLTCSKQIASAKFTGEPKIINLAKFAIDRLQRKGKKGDDPRQNFLDEIDVILFDYHRSRIRKILTEKELKKYYQQTFFPVIDLMLIGLNSKLRAKDIAEFSFCQGRVYTIRDLDQDWKKGIINIPKEILTKAKLNPDSSVGEIKNSTVVKDYFRQQLLLCRRKLSTLEKKLARADESLTTRMCMGLINPLYKLNKRYLNDIIHKFYGWGGNL